MIKDTPYILVIPGRNERVLSQINSSWDNRSTMAPNNSLQPTKVFYSTCYLR